MINVQTLIYMSESSGFLYFYNNIVDMAKKEFYNIRN